MVPFGAADVPVDVKVSFEVSEDGSALVLDVNVEVFIKDIFEAADGLEESMTTCSVFWLAVSVSTGLAAEVGTIDNVDVFEDALDSTLDLDVTVVVFTEEIFVTVDCFVDSKELRLLLSPVLSSAGEGDVDDNVIEDALGTVLVLDENVEDVTEDLFEIGDGTAE